MSAEAEKQGGIDAIVKALRKREKARAATLDLRLAAAYDYKYAARPLKNGSARRSFG